MGEKGGGIGHQRPLKRGVAGGLMEKKWREGLAAATWRKERGADRQQGGGIILCGTGEGEGG
jgi:hypothetical protein